jgi:ABC-2 type transport system permease protein
VIRKDLTRFWPVWGSYLAIWLLVLPIPLLNNRYYGTSFTDILQDVHRQVVYAGGEAALVMTAAYGGLAAFAVWSYLYQSRSASLFHALPVTRETLFCSHFTAGLSFLLLPNVLIAVITYLCQAVLGYFDPTQILCWLAVVCLESFLFFTLGTLAAKAVLFLAGFLLVLLLWKLLCNALNLVAKLPGLHGINKILGGILGLIKGWLILMVARWVLCDFLGWIPPEVAAESRLLAFLAAIPIPSLLGL